MAEHTGVRESTRPAGKQDAGKGGSFFKKHKGAVIGVGGLGAVLLLSKHGSSSSGSGTDQGQLAAYQAGSQDAAGLLSGAVGASGGGGGQPIIINVPPSTGGGGGDTTHKCPTGHHWDAGKGKCVKDTPGKGGGGGGGGNGHGHGKPKLTANQKARKKGLAKPGVKYVSRTGKPLKAPPAPHGSIGGRIAPKSPHNAKPGPANSKGQNTGTRRSTPKGHAKHSPAEAMSPQAGAGVTIMGKTFVGARGYQMHPPRIGPGGQPMRDVTVHYDGHTERHTAGPSGEWWELNSRGRNPMSRGVPSVVLGGGVE